MPLILQEALAVCSTRRSTWRWARDAFSAEGVEIRFTSSPHPDATALRVMDGTVDVSWGGPMRVMETYHKLAGCDLVCFGEVVTRDPFLLMGRTPKPDFPGRPQVGDARHGERSADALALPAARPALGRHRSRRHQARDRPDDAENMAALKAGTVDVIQVFEPFPSLLLARAQHTSGTRRRGVPDLLHLLLRAARHAGVAARRAPALVRAIDRTEKWVAKATGPEIANAIAGYFADVPPAILAAAARATRRWASGAARDPAACRLRPAARRTGDRRLRFARHCLRDRRRQHAGRGRDLARAANARVIASALRVIASALRVSRAVAA